MGLSQSCRNPAQHLPALKCETERWGKGPDAAGGAEARGLHGAFVYTPLISLSSFFSYFFSCWFFGFLMGIFLAWREESSAGSGDAQEQMVQEFLTL